MDKYPIRKYPIVGVCGLNCGLCPRYHTEGSSRCPGCCGADFWDKMPGCSFITCCVKKKGLETCAECAEFDVCERVAKLLDAARSQDSFLSHRPIAANFSFIRDRGIAEFACLETEKQEFLKYLLANYDEGRSKSFYCTGCQLVPLDRLRQALKETEAKFTQDTTVKEKAKILRAAINNTADGLGIDLRLRK